MDQGPMLAQTLLCAHRTNSSGVVCADDLTLHMCSDRVLFVEGVPDLLLDLSDRSPELTGDLAVDMPILLASGVPRRRIIDAACGGLQRVLVRLLRKEKNPCTWQPDAPPPPAALELPVPMLRLFSQALAEARDPYEVKQDFLPVLDTELLVDVSLAETYKLDLIARRTLAQAVSEATLRDLIRSSGRGQMNRTRHAWRAWDLLYHLGLVSLDLEARVPKPRAPQESGEDREEGDTEPLKIVVISEGTDPLPVVMDPDVTPTDELPDVELGEPMMDTAPQPEWVGSEALEGDWTGDGECVEVPISLFDLRRLAFEFTWSNPLEVVGLSSWEEASPQNIGQALARRMRQFRPTRFYPDLEAMEASATCLRLVRAACAMVRDEESRKRWDEDRNQE